MSDISRYSINLCIKIIIYVILNSYKDLRFEVFIIKLCWGLVTETRRSYICPLMI